jgi:hypothetical protein
MAVFSLSRVPIPLTVPRFASGLISILGRDSRVCSGLHTTPVATFDFRLTFGPDSAPGSLASRCGSLGLDLTNGSRFQAPGTFSLARIGFSLYSSRSDFLTARNSNLSVERLGQFRSTHNPCLRWSCLRSLFAGPDRTPKFIATWSGSTLLTTLALLQDQVFRLVFLQASCSISRAEFSLHSSCLDHRHVSLSSVETLRRAQVCTLPLSLPHLPFHR